MQDEIVAGLKNALERGSSMERAIQSFINAGYNPATVREAAQFLSMGASAIVLSPQPKHSQQPQQSQQYPIENKLEDPYAGNPPIQNTMQSQFFYQQKPKESVARLVLVIILIILLVAILGGIVATFLFEDKILSWLKL